MMYSRYADSLIQQLNESGIKTVPADQVAIDEALSETHADGYTNGVNIEMGDGRGVEFDGFEATNELLRNLSFETATISPTLFDILYEAFDKAWESGTANGGWDS